MLKTVSSITNAIGALNYKGTWDANANSPALTSSVGTKGDYYVVSTAGTTNLNGISNWGVGDWAAFNGSVWQRVEGGADGNFVNLSVSGTSDVSTLSATSGIAVGGATAGASGVAFPATAVAVANANTLDDYEEGTWTAGIAFGGASAGVTYSGQQGTYTKVGRQVTCIGVVALTSKGSSTGAATITGLPFTVAANEPNYGGVAFGYNYQVTFADMLFGRTLAGGTTIVLAETTNAGVDSEITNADFTNASVLRFTLTYFV